MDKSRKDKRIMIIAGEASGDLHGGMLAAEILKIRPDAQLFGIGGASMRKAGVDTMVDASELAVVGLWEVISQFSVIRRAFNKAKDALYNDPPSLVVLIDYPDFNLRLAAHARRAGVPVVYYVSPQVWAWRRGRIKKMAKLVTRMLVVFPFEEKLYTDAGMDCKFVGHPLLDEMPEKRDRRGLAEDFGLDPDRPILGLLPGSRRKELRFHLPVMLEAFNMIKENLPGVQGVIPVAGTLSMADFEPYMEVSGGASGDVGGGIKLVEGDFDGVAEVMDAAVVASGTATLQVALHEKPMVIIYRLSPITYHIGRMLIKLPHIGMVNIISGEEVVPELIQDSATPENISSLILKYFCDKAYYGRVAGRLAGVRAKLGGAGGSERAARQVVDLLDG